MSLHAPPTITERSRGWPVFIVSVMGVLYEWQGSFSNEEAKHPWSDWSSTFWAGQIIWQMPPRVCGGQ